MGTLSCSLFGRLMYSVGRSIVLSRGVASPRKKWIMNRFCHYRMEARDCFLGRISVDLLLYQGGC